MRRHLLLPLLASLLPAQDPTTDPLGLIATAERRLARQAPDEDAAMLLRQAGDLLRARNSSFARDAALTAVQSLLPRADPVAAERSKTFADAARKIAEVATLYRLRKWYELADDRLQVALRLDADAAQKEVQALATARGKDAPKPAAKPEPASKPDKPLIPDLVASNTGGDWTIENDQLVAPRESPKAANYWFLTNTRHEDAELSVEVKITDGQGLATLVFGSLGPRDQFRATLERRAIDQWALRCECDNANALDRLQVVDGCPPPARDGWHRLVVRVRGKSVQMDVDGVMSATAEMPRAAHGAVGFIIYGMGETTPIRFRNLQIGPLPDKQDDACAAAAAQAALRQSLMAAVEQGEKLLAEKKPEAAVLALRQAWAEARRLDPGALRDNLEASVEKQLAKADPVHGRRKKAAQEVGALFANLAARYQTAGFLRTALDAADQAAAFDPAAHASLRQQIEAVIAAHDAAEAAARQQELAPPALDNAALLAAFGSGRPLFQRSHPWVVDANGARAQQLTDGEITALLAPGLPQAGGRFGLHVHLAQVGAVGGFVFDARGDNDFAIAVLHRGPQQLTLSLHRYYLGKWQTLGRQVVPVPAWRLAGWFELRLEDLAEHVKVAAGEVELQVERSKLGAIGPVGLCAEVAGAGPADVEIRGFAALEAAK